MDVKVLKEIGGQEWQKNGMHRVYFNDLAGWYGLRTTRYNSGNISGATLNGEAVSNTYARKLILDLIDAKLWYDVPTKKWQGRGIAHSDFDVVVANIKAKAQAAEAAQAQEQAQEQEVVSAR